MRPANSTAASTLSTTSLVTQGWPMASMASLKPWRSSALRMDSGLVPSRRTPYFSRMPCSWRFMARFSPVWPPRVGRMESGRSLAMTCSTLARFSGSTYTWSAMSLSVMMVAGLELTSTTSTPSSLRARQAWVPA